jgi:hypothetical protein
VSGGRSPGFLRLFLAQAIVTLHRAHAKLDKAEGTPSITPELAKVMDRALESGEIGPMPRLMLDSAVAMVMGDLARRPGLLEAPIEHLRNCDGNPCECGADPQTLKLVQKGPHAELDGYRIVVVSDPDVPNALAQAVPLEHGSRGLASAGVYATAGGGVVLSVRHGRTIPASVVRALLNVAEGRP